MTGSVLQRTILRSPNMLRAHERTRPAYAAVMAAS